MVVSSGPSPSDRPVPVQPAITAHPAPSSRGQSPDQAGRTLGIAVAAGLVAGVASLLAGEAILRAYQGDLLPRLEIRPDPKVLRRLDAARVYSAAATFAAMGAVLGLAMGLAGGLVRRSAPAAARAAIVGILLGAATAALTSAIFVPYFFKRYNPDSGDLVLSFLTHGVIWTSVGATCGLAFGVGLGGHGHWKTTLVGGVAGAVAATILYEIIGALAFPSGKTDHPLASSIIPRAMAHVLVTVLTAAGAALALRQSPTAPPSPTSPPRG